MNIQLDLVGKLQKSVVVPEPLVVRQQVATTTLRAVTNGGTVGMGARYTTATNMISSSTGSTMPYLSVTQWSIDSSSPIDGFVPYSGVTSYKGGPRTFFTSLADISGIDTSATGAPPAPLLNNQSYTAYKATTITVPVVQPQPIVESLEVTLTYHTVIMSNTSGHSG